MRLVVDNLAAVTAGMNALADHRVMVGVPEDRGQRREPGEPSNAELAYIHDNGAPEAGIPARPFLGAGLREDAATTEAGLAHAGMLAASGAGVAKVLAQLRVVGLRAVNAVRRKISTGPFVPLAPATVAARRRRSKGSKYRRKATTAADVTPLIDTGQLRNAVTFVLRKVK